MFSFFWYASVSLNDLAVVFGGTHDGTNALNGIYGYNNNGWFKLGTLKQARHQHSAISNGNEIMIVGGLTPTTLETEIWKTDFSHNRTINQTLSGFHFYPELFLVPYDFPSNATDSKSNSNEIECFN